MRFVNIEIFHTGQTRVNRSEVLRWMEFLKTSEEFREELDRLMTEFRRPDDNRGGELSDPALLIALAAKRCYMSFEPGLNPNVTRVRKEWTEYLDNVLSMKHGSVLEHSVHNFAFENVSRVFTAEMNRHRAGVAVSEGSMRFIRYRDIPMWLPTSIQLTEEEERQRNDGIDYIVGSREFEIEALTQKKLRTQAVFEKALKQDEENYAELQAIWKDALADSAGFAGKKHITSMMRRIIPMGVATGGCWSLNIRALRHVMAMRASPQAEEEMLEVWSRAGKIMVETEPAIFGDFFQEEEGYWIPKYDKV